MKKFVVLLAAEKPEQVTGFRNYLSEVPAGWWHWIPNSWLITNRAENLTTERLRDKLVEIYPDVTNMVIELRGEDTWSGFGPGEKYFEWLRDTWK